MNRTDAITSLEGHEMTDIQAGNALAMAGFLGWANLTCPDNYEAHITVASGDYEIEYTAPEDDDGGE